MTRGGWGGCGNNLFFDLARDTESRPDAIRADQIGRALLAHLGQCPRGCRVPAFDVGQPLGFDLDQKETIAHIEHAFELFKRCRSNIRSRMGRVEIFDNIFLFLPARAAPYCPGDLPSFQGKTYFRRSPRLKRIASTSCGWAWWCAHKLTKLLCTRQQTIDGAFS